MVFLFVFILFLTIIVVKHYRKAWKLPPGPLTLPFIGNLFQLIYYGWKFGGIVPMMDFFRRKYGNLFTIWFGPYATVSIADYKTNYEVFVKNGDNYKDRASPALFEHLYDGHGFFFANGEIPAEMRRFTMQTFRNLGIGRDVVEEKVLEEINERCAELDSNAVDGTSIVSHRDLLELMIGNLTNSLIVGKTFDEDGRKEFLKFRKLQKDFDKMFSLLDFIFPLWVLKKFFAKRYQTMSDYLNKTLDYFGDVAEERLEDVKNGKCLLDREHPNDFIDAFLSKMTEKEEKNGGHPAYTLKSLKFVIADLWSAGLDTTVATLTSGFNQLVNNPEAVKKVREELMAVTNNNLQRLSWKERTETPYFNATLAEIQRHASILNVNFWKAAGSSTTLNGYELDAGEFITSQLGTMHVNEDVYKDSWKFYPERFLEDKKLMQQLIPFGIGKRSCIGEVIARNNIYLIIGNLLLRYDIQPHGNLPSTADKTPFDIGKLPDDTAKIEFKKL